MLIQSYGMLSIVSIKHVAVQNSLSFRQCRPALVSNKQDSGRAGPEKSVLYKHKSRVYLICSLLVQSNNMLSRKHVAVRNSPIYKQCRPARVSSKQDSGRVGPEKRLLSKHESRIYLIAHTEK